MKKKLERSHKILKQTLKKTVAWKFRRHLQFLTQFMGSLETFSNPQDGSGVSQRKKNSTQTEAADRCKALQQCLLKKSRSLCVVIQRTRDRKVSWHQVSIFLAKVRRARWDKYSLLFQTCRAAWWIQLHCIQLSVTMTVICCTLLTHDICRLAARFFFLPARTGCSHDGRMWCALVTSCQLSPSQSWTSLWECCCAYVIFKKKLGFSIHR